MCARVTVILLVIVTLDQSSMTQYISVQTVQPLFCFLKKTWPSMRNWKLATFLENLKFLCALKLSVDWLFGFQSTTGPYLSHYTNCLGFCLSIDNCLLSIEDTLFIIWSFHFDWWGVIVQMFLIQQMPQVCLFSLLTLFSKVKVAQWDVQHIWVMINRQLMKIFQRYFCLVFRWP